MRTRRIANLSVVTAWTILLLITSCANSLPSFSRVNACQWSVLRVVSVSSSEGCVWHRSWNRVLDSMRAWYLPWSWSNDKNGPTFDSNTPNTLRTHHHQDLVLRFTLASQQEATALLEASDTLGIDVWATTIHWIDLRLPQNQFSDLLLQLPKPLNNSYKILLNERELSEAISDTLPSVPSDYSAWHSNYQADAFFKDYQPLSVIYPWMRLLASLFSNHVEMIKIGVTYEGRDIPALRLGVSENTADAFSESRKTIVISGGSHAREWISTSTVNYVAYWFITSYGKSSEVTRLLNEFDWVFIPTLNPDGYEYTWNNDRLWRKNRQKTPGGFCHGIDLDRTWDFMWDGSHTSGNPCSETFAGENPFEGVESRYFAEWAKNQSKMNNTQFVGFLDLHSYSQQILYPFSYSCDATPPTLEDLEELGHGLAKAIRVYDGKDYKVTPACKGNVDISSLMHSRKLSPQFSTGGGSALDWFYHEMSVRHSYQIKLRDTGSYGFLLPKKYIVPTGAEILQAIRYFGNSLSRSSRMIMPSENHVPTNSIPQDQKFLVNAM